MLSIFKAGNYNIDFSKNIITMGILNLTPDSFSDGGLYNDIEKAVNRAIEIEKLGADILDIGGQSTRPGCVQISAKEEWSRIYPVLKKISNKINIPISIDTFYPEVAEKALDLGVSIINDVSGLKSIKMFEVISKSKCGIIVVHSSLDMNIKNFFRCTVKRLNEYGVDKNRICLDPGIGFKENREQDRFIINNLNNFRIDNLPMLIGVSRKRVISEYYDNKNQDLLLQGSIVANTLAIANGANVLRVHDIKESIISSSIAKDILKTRIV